MVSNIKNKSRIKGENERGASLSRVNGQGPVFEKVILDKNPKAMKGVAMLIFDRQ